MPSFGDIILAIAPYVIGFLVAFVGFISFSLSRQQKLFNFLGADKKYRRVLIYLSSLLIPDGCAIGFDGLPRSYQGITIPTEELSISARLCKSLGG